MVVFTLVEDVTSLSGGTTAEHAEISDDRGVVVGGLEPTATLYIDFLQAHFKPHRHTPGARQGRDLNFD